jgi:3-oxoacyl-[acyl-carrier protein] reductase
MIDLSGKNALVTGASGGIGAAIARSLSAAGAKVVLSGTRREALEETQKTLRGESSIVVANLQDKSATLELAAKAKESFGEIGILVCNAGITRDTLSMRMKEEDWDDVLDTNLKSTFLLIQASLRDMTKNRAGRIICITSIIGHMGNAGQANYAASKGGMTAMVKSIAQEVASRGITANCVAPGFIATPMTDKLTDEQKAKISGNIPAGRMGSPEDIAGGVAFLASDAASYITGQTLHINGGMLMA